MLLLEVLVVLGGVDVEPAVGDDAPALDRVLVRVRERDELAVDLVARGSRSLPSSGTVSSGDLARPLERLDERRQLALARRPVEAADADVDRMHLAPADDAHHLVAGLLQLQAALDDLRGVAGELDRARDSRGSRARGACRCAARGSRSTRRSRAAGAASRIGSGDLDAAEALHRVSPRSSGRRPDRSRRSAR